MLNADRMTLEEVQRIFPDVEFMEAAGVLEMISKTPEQQMIYDARLKFQRHVAARLELARDEGLREGEARGEARGVLRGEMLGQIKLLQPLLGAIESTPDELSKYEQSQLKDLVEELQRRLRLRGQATS
jgi:flagellar biosynthesis/type III secretory pathway protein FliH